MNTRPPSVSSILSTLLIAASGPLSGCVATPIAHGTPDRRPDLTSNLQIEAGQTFVYAGEGAGAFRISVLNVGTVGVSAASRVNDTETPVQDVPPGASAFLEFAPGQAALFRNAGRSQARLKLQVWGDTNVEMRYQPNPSAR